MAALKTLIVWLALLFHALFCLSIAALGAFSLLSGGQSIRLAMLPWSGAGLALDLLIGGIFGLAATVLAAFYKLRLLFLLWSLLVAILLTKTLVFSGYRIPPGEWQRALYLVAAAWFAAAGAVLRLLAPPPRGPRKYRVK